MKNVPTDSNLKKPTRFFWAAASANLLRLSGCYPAALPLLHLQLSENTAPGGETTDGCLCHVCFL